MDKIVILKFVDGVEIYNGFDYVTLNIVILLTM